MYGFIVILVKSCKILLDIMSKYLDLLRVAFAHLLIGLIEQP